MQNYFTQNSFSRKISRFSAFLFFAVIVGVLAGCSGGSDTPTAAASATTPTTPTTSATPVAPAAASLQLLVSSPQMPSSGGNPVDLTAIVLSATKQTLSGKTVTFTAGTATDTAYVDNVSASGVSDANGRVTAKLNLGGNKVNRTIKLTATADSANAENSVDVTGTGITVSGTSSIAFNDIAKLIFAVKDSAGTALPNMTVNFNSENGNTISPATGVTDTAGQIIASVKADSLLAVTLGKDVITANAVTGTTTYASVKQPLTISSASFAFTAPAVATEIPLTPATGSAPTVTVEWADAATSPIGKTVYFTITRGTIAGGTVTPDSSTLPAAGKVSVTVSSATAGPAIITASGPGGTPAATREVVFVATSANNVTVQAVPGTIQVTTGVASQTNNSSTISVLVRDKANNLVKNAGVSFTVTVDPSGGALKSARAITDVNGSASVIYAAGTTSSASNGVTIQATVTDINGVPIIPVVMNTTTLTVAGQVLEVRLGTDNLVGGTAPVYTKTYVAMVTDAAGNAVAGTEVRFALRPSRYFKGYYTFDIDRKVWVQTITATCLNEDLNFNGILDVPPVVLVNEDDKLSNGNGNGRLDPGNVATVTGAGITDASGVATATITYPMDRTGWAELIIEGRAGVIGNDPPDVRTFVLPGASKDFVDADVLPPGAISPYGTGDPNASIFTNPVILPNLAVVTCRDTN